MLVHIGIFAVCLYLCIFSLPASTIANEIIISEQQAIDRIETKNLSSKAASVVVKTGSSLYNRAFFWPIYRLYRHGPSLHGYGFWRGAPSHEICAALTNVESDFWKNHSNECESLIAKEVQAYVVLIETVTYFGLLLYVLKSSAQCLCRLHNRDTQHTKRLYSPPRRRSTPLYLSTPPRTRTQ